MSWLQPRIKRLISTLPNFIFGTCSWEAGVGGAGSRRWSRSCRTLCCACRGYRGRGASKSRRESSGLQKSSSCYHLSVLSF